MADKDAKKGEEEDTAPPGHPQVPTEIAKKMPWWGYLTMTMAPLVVGGSGYGGSLVGASQQAKANAVEIISLKQTVENLTKSVDDQSKAMKDQNGRIERLTVVIAASSDIDINALLGSNGGTP